jgi:hypothetical protein
MSKFHIKLKIQNFELEVDGNRDDVPLITQAVGQEIAGILMPATTIVEGDATNADTNATIEAEQISTTRKPLRQRRQKNSNTESVGSRKTKAIDFKHNTEEFGTARQDWSTANKAIWLLYVLAQQGGANELSGSQIAATFNKHFKQAKTIVAANVNRDLGKLKVVVDTPVSEDTTKSPSLWYLTQAGVKKAQGLVAEALGKSVTS